MTRPAFFKHFDLLADQPDAVAKMRELVLQLAVSGRLVAHDEGGAETEWRSRVFKGRSQAIESLKLKRHPETGPLAAGELPYNLPEQWLGVRLGDLAYSCPTSYGEHPSPDLATAGVITVGNIDNTGCFKGQFSERGYPRDEFDGLVARKGDLIVVKSSGSAENVHSGKTALCTEEHDGKIVGSNFVMRLRRFADSILPEFLWLVMKSRITRAWVERTVQTMTYPNLKWSEYAKLPVGVPPLAEQRRIVAKVDELMGLCDELAARQQARHAARAQLQQSALHQLLAAREPHTFAPAWQRLRDHFHLLHDTPDALPQLRQAILQLAVQGRLVPQDEAVAKTEDDDLPVGWRSVRLSEVADHRLGKMLDQQKNRGTPHPYLRNTNVHWFRFELDSIKELRLEDDELETYTLKKGDVLICEGGHGIGRTAVWSGEVPGMLFQKALHRVRPSKHLDSHFFSFCMKVYADTGVLEDYFTGAGIPHLTGQSLAKLRFPLPPLAEQERIVARVEALLRQCDALEAQLRQTRTLGAHLLDSTLHHLLAA